MKLPNKLFALFILVALAGCQSGPALMFPATLPAVTGTSENWIRTELYFGLTRRDGSRIAEPAWQEFVARCITQAFPDGFTIVRAQGQYLDEHKTLHVEPSRVVIVLHPGGPGADARINGIIATYIATFDQESVLRVDAAQAVSFVHACGK
jgi:hypothetical protein